MFCSHGVHSLNKQDSVNLRTRRIWYTITPSILSREAAYTGLGARMVMDSPLYCSPLLNESLNQHFGRDRSALQYCDIGKTCFSATVDFVMRISLRIRSPICWFPPFSDKLASRHWGFKKISFNRQTDVEDLIRDGLRVRCPFFWISQQTSGRF